MEAVSKCHSSCSEAVVYINNGFRKSKSVGVILCLGAIHASVNQDNITYNIIIMSITLC